MSGIYTTKWGEQLHGDGKPIGQPYSSYKKKEQNVELNNFVETLSRMCFRAQSYGMKNYTFQNRWDWLTADSDNSNIRAFTREELTYIKDTLREKYGLVPTPLSEYWNEATFWQIVKIDL